MPHWLIIDLEATTDEGGWPVSEMEIIEIGVTLVNRQPRADIPSLRAALAQPLWTPFCRQLRTSPGHIEARALTELRCSNAGWASIIAPGKAGQAGATSSQHWSWSAAPWTGPRPKPTPCELKPRVARTDAWTRRGLNGACNWRACSSTAEHRARKMPAHTAGLLRLSIAL